MEQSVENQATTCSICADIEAGTGRRPVLLLEVLTVQSSPALPHFHQPWGWGLAEPSLGRRTIVYWRQLSQLLALTEYGPVRFPCKYVFGTSVYYRRERGYHTAALRKGFAGDYHKSGKKPSGLCRMRELERRPENHLHQT